MATDTLTKSELKGSGFRLPLDATVYLLVGIWAVAILVRVVLFTGYVNGDMGNYIQEAMAWFDGRYSIHDAFAAHRLEELIPGPNFNWQNLRIGLILLYGLSMKIFGINDFSYAVLMFGFFTVGYAMTYVIGVELRCRAFGVIAACLFAFIPKEINLTTILAPHLPADALMAVSCYLLIRAMRAQKTAKTGYLLFFLSGIAVGLAYLFHELSILLMPVLVLTFWSRFPLKKIFSDKSTFTSLSLVLTGFGLVFLAEQIYFYSISGVLLLRFKFIAAMSQKWIELNPIDKQTIDYGIYPAAMLASYDYGIFYYLAAGGFGILCFKYIRSKDHRTALQRTYFLPVVWFAFIFMYLQFGSTSLTSYKPVFKLAHYLSFVAVPASLMAAVVPLELISAGAGSLRGRQWKVAMPGIAAIAGLLFFVGSSTLFAWVNYSGQGPFRPDLTNEKKIDAIIDKLGENEIYTDIWTKHGLDFISGRRKKIVAYNSSGPGDMRPPADLSSVDRGLVVVNWIYLNSPYTMASTIPEIVWHPPKSWQLVGKVPGYRHSIDIYRIKKGVPRVLD